MNWNQLINTTRLGSKNRQSTERTPFRPEFQKDYDRLVFSSPFRRLQDKTQVFPLPGSVFVHNRLTHSLEVASIGKTLGDMVSRELLKDGAVDPRLINETGTIVSTACLAHDLGNPPFGHSGEDAISEFFVKRKNDFAKFNLTEAQWNDFTRYEGNAHGFRLLTNHHPDEIKGGLRLTYATLATFAKYPRESHIPEEELVREDLKRTSAKKFNFFQTERALFKETARETGLRPLTVTDSESLAYCRHPLAFLVEAADNICYRLIDLEDGYKLGFLDFNTVEELLIPFMKMSGDKNQAMTKYGMIKDKGEKVGYLRAKAISVLINESIEVFKENYNEIMNGNFDAEITDHISSTKLLEGEIKKANIFKRRLCKLPLVSCHGS